MRLAKCGAASGREHDVFLGAASADGFGLAAERANEPLFLHAPQRAVDRAERGLALCPLDEKRANAHAVRVFAEPGQRQEDQLFELTEVIGHGSRSYTAQCAGYQ